MLVECREQLQMHCFAVIQTNPEFFLWYTSLDSQL